MKEKLFQVWATRHRNDGRAGKVIGHRRRQAILMYIGMPYPAVLHAFLLFFLTYEGQIW